MVCPFARQQTALWCNCTCLSYALLWRRCSCHGYHHANRPAKADIQQSSQRAQLFLSVSCWRLIVQGLWWNASPPRRTRTSSMLSHRTTLCSLSPGKESATALAAKPRPSMNSRRSSWVQSWSPRLTSPNWVVTRETSLHIKEEKNNNTLWVALRDRRLTQALHKRKPILRTGSMLYGYFYRL